MDTTALVQEVVLHPFDDRPRQRFADFAEAMGDELRARFVRAQLELARARWGDGELAPEQQVELSGWIATSFTPETQRAWAGSASTCEDFQFRRGFVEHVVCDAPTLLELPNDQPIVSARVVSLGDVAPKELFASRQLLRLAALDLQGLRLSPSDIMSLARARSLSGLKWLSLRGVRGLDAGTVAHLFHAFDDLLYCDLRDTEALPALARPTPDGDSEWVLPPLGQMLMKRYGLRGWQMGLVDYGPDADLYDLARRPERDGE